MTRNGEINFYESTMQSPIDPQNPIWKDVKYNFLSVL